MKQFTVIWEKFIESGIGDYYTTHKTWVYAKSIQDVMEKYGYFALYIFEGFQCSIGESIRLDEIVELN